MFTPLAIVYVFVAAFFFMLANLSMKILADQHPAILYSATIATITLGAYFEVQALKIAQLGHAVVFILSLEMLLSILIAVLFLKEVYSWRDAVGFGCVLAGLLILTDFGTSKPAENAVDNLLLDEHLEQDEARLWMKMPELVASLRENQNSFDKPL